MDIRVDMALATDSDNLLTHWRSWSGRRDSNSRPPAPKADELPNFPSIESGIYGTCLLEVVEMTSYNSRYIAPLHLRQMRVAS